MRHANVLAELQSTNDTSTTIVGPPTGHSATGPNPFVSSFPKDESIASSSGPWRELCFCVMDVSFLGRNVFHARAPVAITFEQNTLVAVVGRGAAARVLTQDAAPDGIRLAEGALVADANDAFGVGV
jgi:hypothetical protein